MHFPYQSGSQQVVQPDEVSAKCQLPQRSVTEATQMQWQAFPKLLCKFSVKLGMVDDWWLCHSLAFTSPQSEGTKGYSAPDVQSWSSAVVEAGLLWTGSHTRSLKKPVLALAFTFLNIFPMNGALGTPLHSHLYNVCGSINSKNKSSYYFLNLSDLMVLHKMKSKLYGTESCIH